MAASIKRDTTLGIVFFLGIFLLLWATAQLGSFSLGKKERVEVDMPHARSLKVGDNVEYLGTKIGVVTAVETLDGQNERPIRVHMELRKKLQLRKDYKIKIKSASLLGGKVVSIEPGTATASIDSTAARLVGIAPPDPIETLGELIGGEGNRKNLAQILENVAALIQELRDGKGTLGAVATSARDFFKKSEALAEDIRAAVAEAREGKGEIGKVVKAASKFFESGETALDLAKNGDGIVARLFKDKSMADDVQSSLKSIRIVANDLEAGRGAAGKMLRDPATSKRLDAITSGIERAVRSVNEGDGILPALLNDPKIKTAVSDIVANLNGVIADVRAGKGTIGRLFTDDTIANQIERLLNQISRTVEDAREAAPVATFVTMFTGVFQ